MARFEVLVPEVADGITSAKIAAWLKHEGDAITAGEPIVEIETDKTTFEVEAPASGVLQILVTANGESVPIGATIGVITSAEAAVVAQQAAPKPRIAEVPVLEEPALEREVAEAPAPLLSQERRATPLAARMMALEGLDSSLLASVGSGARITKKDVELVLKGRHAAPAQTQSVAKPRALAVAPSEAVGQGPFEDRPLTAMRRVTAERLQRAKQTIPHFYLRTDCCVDALLDLRARVKDRSDVIKPTVTDFMVLAAARALREFQAANSMWLDSGVRVFDRIDIAVAVNTPAGLITPIVRTADQKSIGIISRELKDLAERARQGVLRVDEYAGGTFTISNLGMFGVTDITPILNPPQTCILGIGAIEQRPIVKDGQVAIGAMMSCTLAADHRAIDGALGAQLLAAIRRTVENPVLLLMF